MSTHSGECYHYMMAIPGKWLQHQLMRLNGHTTRIRVLRHSRLSNPANQEALTLLYKENISHGVQKNDSNTNTEKTLPNDRNYFRYREIIIVRANNILLRDSTTGATSHGRDRKSANKINISATIVKDRNYWFLKYITSVDILNNVYFCYKTPCDDILINSIRIKSFSTCNTMKY